MNSDVPEGSEWSQMSNFSASVAFNEMMMMSALCQANTLTVVFIVVALWNNSPLVDMSPHSDIILNRGQPVFDLTPCCRVLRGEATNTNFIIFGLTRTHDLSHSKASMLTITPLMRCDAMRCDGQVSSSCSTSDTHRVKIWHSQHMLPENTNRQNIAGKTRGVKWFR